MSALPDPVELEISPEGVAVVRLNRPARRNAFDESLIATATEIFRTLKSADHVRFVALMGAGETFCAGADLDWMKRQGGHSQADNEADALALAEMLKALHDLPQFTCAFVQGAAMGGGARDALVFGFASAVVAPLAPALVDLIASGPQVPQYSLLLYLLLFTTTQSPPAAPPPREPL
jgi:methylglutaconyl-CoA hydratase